MINQQRLIKTFIELAKIPGLSRKERKIANVVSKHLKALGVRTCYDRALAKDGECGNLIGCLDGDRSLPRLLINAHLDTVAPIENFGYRRKGNYIESKGKSILGADDRSGVTVIIEVLKHLVETNLKRPPLEIVFTVAEEIGLVGAKQLDYSLIQAKYGIVLDSDSPLELVISAPQAYRLIFRVYGKSAHAGVSPEKGINAIKIASQAISQMNLGRIDFETTANIGIIQGGTATNIVPELVEARGEARSHNLRKLKAQVEHMRACFQKALKTAERAGEKSKGLPRLEEEIVLEYPKMKVSENSPLVQLLKFAGKKLGKKVITKQGGGGSDANIFNAHKIESIILGSGMEQVHTTEERLNLDQLYLSAQILAKAIELYPKVIAQR